MKACYKKCKQAGIGLLELMLAMAIIAILVVMSIAYFSSSKNSELVSAGTEQMQDIFGVLSSLSHQGLKSDEDITSSVTLSGSIPKQYINNGTLITPWGKSTSYKIVFTADDTTPYATITSTGLPNYACEALADQFPGKDSKGNEKDNVISSNCGSSSELKIEYDMSNRQDLDLS